MGRLEADTCCFMFLELLQLTDWNRAGVRAPLQSGSTRESGADWSERCPRHAPPRPATLRRAHSAYQRVCYQSTSPTSSSRLCQRTQGQGHKTISRPIVRRTLRGAVWKWSQNDFSDFCLPTSLLVHGLLFVPDESPDVSYVGLFETVLRPDLLEVSHCTALHCGRTLGIPCGCVRETGKRKNTISGTALWS